MIRKERNKRRIEISDKKKGTFNWKTTKEDSF